MGIHIILARSPADRAPSVRATAIVAAVLEAIIFVTIPCLSLAHVAPWAPNGQRRSLRVVWFKAGLLLCTVAAALSISNLALLSKVVDVPSSTILGTKATNFMVGSAVVLGLAFATQLAFFVCHFLAGREQNLNVFFPGTDGGNQPLPNVKSIPYHETAPITKESGSFESPTPPGSSGGRSATETITSLRSSLSTVVRPMNSRTRLLSVSRRSSHRPPSLDTTSPRQSRTRSTVEGFDSWDTSAVDPDNRQTVLESSSPPLTRFLEPIPASPATSRSPSPGTPVEILEPPRARRRSRSFSPVSTRIIEAQRAAFTQQESNSEAHIHPLFRSDSPVPPPSATPGTVVVAAPNAGQIIAADKQSIRSIKSMRRLRSESLPTVPSPLGRAESCDSFVGGVRSRAGSISPEEGIREEEDEVLEMGARRRVVVAEGERKMTPPIPEWVLGAGTPSPRGSLRYNKVRRSRTVGEEERRVAEQGV
ncbi:hypothetical protein N0V88_001762 [Collariella sp. IMI 366227]|nr:hypothetical protein N0V88_001762 [Collariella sp. IMI 366227]